MSAYGRRVAPRRLAWCFTCGCETVQWLTHVATTSPGSYRGTRISPSYTCAKCGEVQV